MVLLGHLSGTAGFGRFPLLEHLADVGVRIFFVISGFLITTLLLKEMDRTAKISLRGFYTRRALRIIPAFLVLVLITGLLASTGAVTLLPNDWLHAMTYTMNFHHPHGWALAHIWSLSVEEQFYLLWPAALVFLGVRRGLCLAAVVLVLAPLSRFAMYHLTPLLRGSAEQYFHNIADTLAVGCLLAGLFNWLSGFRRYQSFLESPWFWLVPLAASGIISLEDRPQIFGLFGASLLNIAIAICIERWVRYPRGTFHHLLNVQPMRFVGALSYSLYLWQQLFLNRNSQQVYNQFPLNIVLAITVALGSYYWIEQPFLRLKDRISAVPATAR